jgi:hypothetical protein
MGIAPRSRYYLIHTPNSFAHTAMENPKELENDTCGWCSTWHIATIWQFFIP